MGASGIHLVSFSDSRFLRWLRHLHRNLVLLKLEAHWRVCAHDNSTANSLQQMGLRRSQVVEMHTINNPDALFTHDEDFQAFSAHREPLDFGTALYLQLLRARDECVWMHLRSSVGAAGFLFLDTDVTLFSDPMPHLSAFLTSSGRTDLALLDDRGPFQSGMYANNGFFFIRQSGATLRLWRDLLREIARRPRLNDQDVLNELLARPGVASELGLSVLPPSFANGYRFYQDRRAALSRLDPALDGLPILVHHNWIEGDGRKWDRARIYDALLPERSAGPCCDSPEAFRALARKSYQEKPPWKGLGKPGFRPAQLGLLKRLHVGSEQAGAQDGAAAKKRLDKLSRMWLAPGARPTPELISLLTRVANAQRKRASE